MEGVKDDVECRRSTVVGRGLARSKTADPASVENFCLKIATATTTYKRGSQNKTAPHHNITRFNSGRISCWYRGDTVATASVIGLTLQFLT
jgi:hypothetical protein